jgi:hypothetical protein
MNTEPISNDVQQLLQVAGAILLVAAGLGDRFGDIQRQIVEWLKSAFRIPDGKCGVVNLVIGVVLGGLLGVYAAWQLERSALLALGVLAGLFSSASAATRHEATMRVKTTAPNRVGGRSLPGAPAPQVVETEPIAPLPFSKPQPSEGAAGPTLAGKADSDRTGVHDPLPKDGLKNAETKTG